MKHEDILTALEEISDMHIAEAEKPPKKRTFLKLVAAAAVIAIGVNLFSGPSLITAYAVTTPSEPRIMERPDIDAFGDREVWRLALDTWEAEQNSRIEVAIQAMSDLSSFFSDGNRQFLHTEQNENKIWSPVNAYIGLAMTAELTEGKTRQQILDTFGVENTDELRKQVSAVWESVYQDDSNEICVLANSLWLEKGLEYNKEAMNALGYHYYASVYQGDLGSNQTNKDIVAWIDNNTGKFLKDSTKNIQLDSDTIMALYSTLYFQARWSSEFSEKNNTQGIFHMPDGETQTIYMNKKEANMDYYWGENFSAVQLSLTGNHQMWLILPDEGSSPKDVLTQGDYYDLISAPGRWEQDKALTVNLSMPKFDVDSQQKLIPGLRAMGITDVFNQAAADFSSFTDAPVYAEDVQHAARVVVDEEGVLAAAYTVMLACGCAPSDNQEEIDFILDRPFLFAITGMDNLPLFAGVVAEP